MRQVSTACGSGRVLNVDTRPRPLAVLTSYPVHPCLNLL
jgi:hypothetical protein